MAKGSCVPVRVVNADTVPDSSVHVRPSRNRISMNPQHPHEPLPIRIGRQQGGQNRGAGSDLRVARPPDVQAVRRREGRHGGALARALQADLGDGQPGLDQADGHKSVGWAGKWIGKWLRAIDAPFRPAKWLSERNCAFLALILRPSSDTGRHGRFRARRFPRPVRDRSARMHLGMLAERSSKSTAGPQPASASGRRAWNPGSRGSSSA